MESETQTYVLYSTQAINHQLHASSWHHNEGHVSGPSPALTSTYSGVAFSEYPSPAPSTTSPPFSQSEQYLGQTQPSPTLSNAGSLFSPTPFSQMDSKIGPERTAPRRARQIMDPIGRVHRTSSGLHRPNTDAPSSLHLPSRRQSLDDNDQFIHGHDDLSLQIGASTSHQLQSPVAHPMTPTSMASPSFPSHTRGHLRATSTASSLNFRAISPAVSVASQLTSVSSTGAPRMGYQSYGHVEETNDPSNEDSPRAKHKKRRLDNAQRKLICQYAQKYPNARQEDIAKVHGVERSTISKILKYKDKWLNMPSDVGNGVSKHRPSKFPELEHEMLNWVEEVTLKGEALTDKSIREAGKEVARRLNIPEDKFKASSGWVENFKSRANIRAGVWLDAPTTSTRPPPPDPESYAAGITGPLLPSSTAVFAALKMNAYTTSPGDGTVAASPCSPIAHDYDCHTSAERVLSGGLIPPPSWNPLGDASSLQPLSAISPHSPTSPHHEEGSSSRMVSPLTHHPMVSLATSQDPSRLEYYSEYNYGPKPVPTLAQTEDAFDMLVSFVDTHRVLKSDEREWLTKIKEALHRYANSSLAERTRSP